MLINLLKLISVVLNFVPQRVILFLGDVLGWIWFYVVPIRRSVVIENLRLAFPEKKENEINQLAQKNYRHYGRSLMEVLQTLTWTVEDYRKRVICEGFEYVRPYQKKGVGGFFLGCHLGNWEVPVPSAGSLGFPVDIVVKRAQNKSVEAFFQWYRQRLGTQVFIETGTAGNILRSLSKGRFVAVMLDQFMGPPIGLPVEFFGRRAGTAVAVALFTEKKDVPVFPGHSYRDRSGRLHTVIYPPVQYPKLSEKFPERLYQKTQAYNDAMEKMVRKHPEQWMWLHRRWKPYRGIPRWSLSKAVLLLALLLQGCASKELPESGIVLPPEPKVSVPDFEQVERVRVTEMEATRIAPKPVPVRKIKPVKKRKIAKKKAKKETKGAVEKKVSEERKPLRVFAEEDLPFRVGEQLKLSLRWMMLPAGTATIEVNPGGVFQGRKTFRLSGRVRSSRIVDAIYKVDNRIFSLIDREAIVPYHFGLTMLETHQNKETRVKFDHDRGIAFYQSDRRSQKWGNEKRNRKDGFEKFAQDMFSALYYARTLDYSIGRQEEFPIYENGKNIRLGLLPVKEELVISSVGAFQCWKIKVSLKINNVLKPMGDIFMWLSKDSKKYIVKFDAKIKIGSLNGSLIAIREK